MRFQGGTSMGRNCALKRDDSSANPMLNWLSHSAAG